MPLFKQDDLHIYYEIQGKGPKLLFILRTASDLRRNLTLFKSSLVKGTASVVNQMALRKPIPKAKLTLFDGSHYGTFARSFCFRKQQIILFNKE